MRLKRLTGSPAVHPAHCILACCRADRWWRDNWCLLLVCISAAVSLSERRPSSRSRVGLYDVSAACPPAAERSANCLRNICTALDARGAAVWVPTSDSCKVRRRRYMLLSHHRAAAAAADCGDWCGVEGGWQQSPVLIGLQRGGGEGKRAENAGQDSDRLNKRFSYHRQTVHFVVQTHVLHVCEMSYICLIRPT